ncbi:chaperone protein dnaJ 11, chloroplastic-like [Nicotiana tabacum]|uniref:Chaperone protein dnaJ 11, chloroplastic-like n=2 Tax=Nicotiana TaxID=4085 RepID=A0A1S3ZQ76_TOBAC|nr:PREDICTED: chaperone protein dnaJ 11, chloroplastic-like [Nicotiana sylvestris]XP_016466454.1 PREDICTED: chaperone protein dnaJ 11, chloroplastic-like [Nicotiana tabacum]
MASTSSSSFLLSTSITGSKFSAGTPLAPPSSVSFRQQRSFSVSAAYSTAERTTTSSNIASQSSLYEVLGLQAGATTHEIKSAYRRLARILHPDVARFQQNSSAEDFIRVQSAYATLSDPEKRAKYDRTLFGNIFGRSVGVSSAGTRSHYTTCRNWETDQCW